MQLLFFCFFDGLIVLLSLTGTFFFKHTVVTSNTSC